MSGESFLKKRRVPRRAYESSIGLLIRGQYTISRAYQIGEGGMMIASPVKLVQGQNVVVTFKLPQVSPTVVRGVVRYELSEEQCQGDYRYGIEFINLGFLEKREVRNYVAEKSMAEFLAMAENLSERKQNSF